MQHAKNVPAGKKIVTEIVEVPGGSISYRLAETLDSRALAQREVRREVEQAIRQFRESRKLAR